jgi:hypothetical protein
MPPCITDAGATGTTNTSVFAPWNHTHCSKVRRSSVSTAADGTVTVAFTPNFTNPPVCNVTAQTTAGVTDIINAQVDGTPTVSSAKFRVNRSVPTVSVLNLVSVTVPVLQTTPGVQTVNFSCIEP